MVFLLLVNQVGKNLDFRVLRIDLATTAKVVQIYTFSYTITRGRLMRHR